MAETSEQHPEPPGRTQPPLPWHRELWSRLSTARRGERFPHALLLEGSPGLGKRRFAQRLAASLLCAEPAGDLEPCGTCRSCHLLAVGNHPAFRLIEPEKAGGQIRVDAVRECVARDGLTSQSGGYKVTVIQPAEAMNAAAANAFLKTLEEPAPWTAMLLVSEQPSRLPATIRSRCQRVGFTTPSESVALAWLAERATGVDAGLLLALAAGSPLKAEALARAEILKLREQRFDEFVGVLAGGLDPVATAQSWQGPDLRLSIEWMSGWALDLARLQISDAPPRVFNPDRLSVLGATAASIPPQRLHRLLAKTLHALRALDTQLNPHLLLEDLLLELATGVYGAPRLPKSASGHHPRSKRES